MARSVAFISAHAGAVDLYTASRSGALARLTETPQVEQTPLWSPDSSLVAYTSAETLPPSSSIRAGGLAAGGRGADLRAHAVPAEQRRGRERDHRACLDRQPNAGAGSAARAALRRRGAGARHHRRRWRQASYSAARAVVGPPIWGAGAGMLAIAVGGNTSEPIGLYRWAIGDAQASRIAPGPPLEMAWNPAGNTLVYRLPSADRRSFGCRDLARRRGADQHRRRSNWPPRWSPDGRLLALGATIVDPAGRAVATLPEPWASPLGWGTDGLYYSVGRANPPNTLELWLWDGQSRAASPHPGRRPRLYDRGRGWGASALSQLDRGSRIEDLDPRFSGSFVLCSLFWPGSHASA